MKHTKNLSVLLLNAQGIQSANSFTQFFEFSKIKKPTFIAICETWLDSYEIKSFHLDGYKIANYFSRSKSSRGGVLLLVKNTYCHSWKKLKLKSFESEFEVCGIETIIDSKIIKIVLV
jgi:hypothetical protein